MNQASDIAGAFNRKWSLLGRSSTCSTNSSVVFQFFGCLGFRCPS